MVTRGPSGDAAGRLCDGTITSNYGTMDWGDNYCWHDYVDYYYRGMDWYEFGTVCACLRVCVTPPQHRDHPYYAA